MSKSLQSNILKLYLVKIAKWFMLFMPIVVLFYEENGLELRHVFILQAIYSVSIVALEIPSGYLADAWGRKYTLVLGSILGFFGFLTYSFSYGFTGFLIAEIILGIGQSLISGADSALLYDSLLESGKKEEYIKYEGRLVSTGNFAEAFAGILGGLLATMSLRYPYYVQTVISATAIPASMLLIEPKTHKKIIKMSLNHILKIVRYSLHDNKELKWNIIYSSVIGAATLTMAWFVQPYLNLVALPLSFFGIMWTLLNLTVGISSMYAHKIEFRLKQPNTIIGIAILIPAGFIALSRIHALWGIAILFLFYIFRGIATPVLKDYINRLCDSDVRATVLSVRNFVIRVFFAVIGPLAGWYSDKYTLQSALLLSGLIFLFFALTTQVFLLKRIKSDN
ncbi:MAG: MFS transporter [Bacteroidetes bacterium GWC2_33_15]|nr:MAG: MFS transporter [Bacteroidetes bacterium GWA2_33_15]OFX49928.1 MAG: MFS transporter [Bacteroidetes bacterium GWC2_33_15]OFX64223.1 MAG: MFS transporter [Bacteroidetes bacterium GWB2_32_14]OFX69636.1 MAG: MFS transporter [Bacteroidetes bacterium GWD2_33_33]HAN19520.1 MFS transporter [Bacteroidales bacterium]